VSGGEIGHRLLATGAMLADRLGAVIDDADPEGTIRLHSRLLCAGLAELAGACHRALGGDPARELEVLEAAALLALLTKLDDQVIDGRPFHGGAQTDRGVLRRRTREWLAPTLESIRLGRPVEDSPRCRLAARFGAAVTALAGDEQRRTALLELVARGWGIQVDAVTAFTDHPSRVHGPSLDVVTGDVSGAWLLMITLVGALPADASRWLSTDEQTAFFDWGLYIQRADALCDLAKDQEEGLISTWAGWTAWHADPLAVDRAIEAGDPGPIYALLAARRLDRRGLPDAATVDALTGRLAELGALPGLLRWIHGFLLGRYLGSPGSRSRLDDPDFARHLSDHRSWQTVDAPRRNATCSEP
jgi:hypothetical protein